MDYLKGKKAFITGARRGIGRAIALTFAKEGADIVVCDMVLDAAARDTVRDIEALGRKAIAVQADVSVRADVDKAVAEALKAFGCITSLSRRRHRPRQYHDEYPGDGQDAEIAVTLKGVVHMCQATAQHRWIGRPPRHQIISDRRTREVCWRRSLIIGKSGDIGFTNACQIVSLSGTRERHRACIVTTIS